MRNNKIYIDGGKYGGNSMSNYDLDYRMACTEVLEILKRWGVNFSVCSKLQ